MTVEQVKNIWENCPKSIEKLIEWYKGQMPKPIGKPEIDIPIQEAFKHADKALQVSMSAGTPRFLYEFFDNVGIYITINKEGKESWEGSADGKLYFGKNRNDVENGSFANAFELMEDYEQQD